MKLVLNIEKKHLIFFSVFLVLMGGVFVIATNYPEWTPSKPFHEPLYVDTIISKSLGYIGIDGSVAPPNSLPEGGYPDLAIGSNDAEEYKWIQSYGGDSLILNPLGNDVEIGTSEDKLIVKGKVCSSNGDDSCKPIGDILNGRTEGIMRIVALWPDGSERNTKLEINQRVIYEVENNQEAYGNEEWKKLNGNLPPCDRTHIGTKYADYLGDSWGNYNLCRQYNAAGNIAYYPSEGEAEPYKIV